MAGKAGQTMRRQKPEEPEKRWPRIVRLMMVGVAVGATAAMMMRRRQGQRQWATYDPNVGLEPAVAPE
jgi:hypothetical protein